MLNRRLFTSESVSEGHPDKIADQISDTVLDAIIEKDLKARVACETLVTTGIVFVTGEVTTDTWVDIPLIVRDTIKDIGYTDSNYGLDYESCAIVQSIGRQSADISQGVSEGEGLHKDQGAGDQGMMYGYACNETEELMPLPIMLAHKLLMHLAYLRKDKILPYLRPDSKSQVTVEYEGDRPVRVHTVVISTQHDPDLGHDQIRSDMIEHVIKEIIAEEYLDGDSIYHINPTGRFVTGGPHGDTGLTGRKIIVDTYGGMSRHGGGAFSGKDPTKVDRCASYAARYVAKNIVAAGLATRAEVQLAYAIGVAEPVSINVDSFGTGAIQDSKISQLVREHFSLTPKGIIESLDLIRPIYRQTSAYGHFGRNLPDFTWEKTDKTEALRESAQLPAYSG